MAILCPELFPKRRPRYRTAARDTYLRENPGICPAILAQALGLSERTVISIQRKLGVRKFTTSNPNGKCSK